MAEQLQKQKAANEPPQTQPTQPVVATIPPEKTMWLGTVINEYSALKINPDELPLVDQDRQEMLDFRYYTPNYAKWLIKHIYMNIRNLADRPKSYPSILLLGPPGVGKSTIVKELAKEIAESNGLLFVDISNSKVQETLFNAVHECETKNLDHENCMKKIIETLKGDEKSNGVFLFFDLRLTELEPQDLVGIPHKSEQHKVTVYYPMKWAVLLSKFPGILFLDEITNVNREDVMSAAYKLFLDKMAGFVQFHPHVLVVAAGNLKKHARTLARSLPPPLVNRSIVVYVGAPDISEWYAWTLNELDRIIPKDDISMFYDYKETLDMVFSILSITSILDPKLFISHNLDEIEKRGINENFPSPRAWTHFVITTPMSLLKKIYEKEGSTGLANYIARYVGHHAANTITRYMPIYNLINPKELLENPSILREIVETQVGSKDNKTSSVPPNEKIGRVFLASNIVTIYVINEIFKSLSTNKDTSELENKFVNFVGEARNVLEVSMKEAGLGDDQIPRVRKSFANVITYLVETITSLITSEKRTTIKIFDRYIKERRITPMINKIKERLEIGSPKAEVKK